jgi:isopenicillin-N N-acyltransferase-like protein
MIPQIVLTGTPREMGLMYGEEFRDKIQEFALSRIARLRQYTLEYCKQTVTEDQLIQRISVLIPPHKNYDNDIWNEFCGIAKGANISYEMLIIAMGYTDLRDYITQQISSEISDVGGCSAFIVPDRHSSQGVLCGQTWDMTVEAFKYLVIVHRRPNNGPETIYLTTMGCLGLIGMNSDGIVVGNTNLMAVDNTQGVNYLFTISRALNARSIDESVGSIVNTPRLAGHNFYVANAEKGVNIEATARLAYCSLIEERIHVHTNHYLNQSLQAVEKKLPKNIYENTHYRFEKMLDNFGLNKKIWDADACWQVLADDERHELGAAICNEDFAGRYGDFATVATAVLIPKEKTMLVCGKGAKSGILQKVSL